MNDWIWDSAEESIPLERRLAQARKKRKELLSDGINDAAKMGEYAQDISQQRAELLITFQDTLDDIKAAKEDALAAQKAGRTEEEASHNADAVRLANEAAEIKAELDSLDKDVEEAFADFRDARLMIVELSRDIQAQARGDIKLVAKVARTDLKEKMLKLKESMLGLTTADDSAEGLRTRALAKAEQKERNINARALVIGDLWEEHRGHRVAESRRISRAGEEFLANAEKEIGYTPTEPALPAPAEKASV